MYHVLVWNVEGFGLYFADGAVAVVANDASQTHLFNLDQLIYKKTKNVNLTRWKRNVSALGQLLWHIQLDL